MTGEKKKGVTRRGTSSIELVGLDSVVTQVISMEMYICKCERFAEEVLLACSMPEIPRLILADALDDGANVLDDAHDAMQRLLVRYRKMTAWFRANKIDVESVVGENDASMMKN